jgi:DNA-binding GntR family transcriptional regulator
MDDQLIDALGTATWLACATIDGPGHHALQASVDLACCVPAGSGWECKAAAHAGFFTALADASHDACAAPVLRNGAEPAYLLMLAAGRVADNIVINSRRRMLASLRSGSIEDAALEMERHLRVLSFMGRLCGSRASSARPSSRALSQ